MSLSKVPPPAFNNWVKCSEGLIECCRLSALIVKNVMDDWHQNDIEPNKADYECTKNGSCKPNQKPKKAKGHCDKCVRWVDIVQKLLVKTSNYEIMWQHSNSPDFYNNMVEVAKLFGLKNIKPEVRDKIKNFDDFDSAWLLSIMEKVILFDRKDVQKQVQVVAEIRNSIMHRPVSHPMSDQDMQKIFDSYYRLVACFKDNFSFISQGRADRLHARLKEIQDMSIVTTDMVQRTVSTFLTEVDTWKTNQRKEIETLQENLTAVSGICQDFPELKDQMVDVRKMQTELDERVCRLESDMESMKEQYSTMSDQKSMKHQGSDDSGFSSNPLSPTSPQTPTPVNGSSMYSSSETSTAQSSLLYDILLIHSKQDIDLPLYQDLTAEFDSNSLTYRSMYEAPLGQELPNFEEMLEECSWKMCVITDNFLKDVWCIKKYFMAMDEAIDKNDESILYIKPAGFKKKKIPAGLKDLTGAEYPDRFFKRILRNTFGRLRKKRAESQGIGMNPSGTASSNEHQNPHESAQHQSNSEISIVGSKNVVVQGCTGTVINIYQGSSEVSHRGYVPSDDSSRSSASMGHQFSSQLSREQLPKEQLPSDQLSTKQPNTQQGTENSEGPGIECSEKPSLCNQECNTDQSSNNSLEEPTSACEKAVVNENESPAPDDGCSTREEPVYKDLVSLETADNKEHEADSCTKLSSSLTNHNVSRVQSLSLESSQLKKSLSSPDIPTALKQEENNSENEIKPKQRLSSSSEPLPFVGYQKSFKPVFNEGEAVKGSTGLQNLGNTCYMNSVLQCLSNATVLAQYFTDGQYESIRSERSDQKPEGGIAEEFARVMSALWFGKYRHIYPTDLFNAVSQRLPMYSDDNMKSRQHDAHEFLLSLIEDGLHKDLNQAEEKTDGNNEEEENTEENAQPTCETPDDELSIIAWNRHVNSNQSIITRIFQGQLRSVVKCQGCKHKSPTFEPFSILTVPLPSKKESKLQECLEEYFKKEDLHGDNAYSCDKCKKRCNATKRMDLSRLPKILVICLKRFTPQLIGKTVFWNKNEAPVKFPLNDLNICKFTSGPKPTCAYNLFAVVNHIGSSTKGGHYTAYCKNAGDKKWYHYNDSDVQEIPDNNIQSTRAYLLFYSCVDLMPPV